MNSRFRIVIKTSDDYDMLEMGYSVKYYYLQIKVMYHNCFGKIKWIWTDAEVCISVDSYSGTPDDLLTLLVNRYVEKRKLSKTERIIKKKAYKK